MERWGWGWLVAVWASGCAVNASHEPGPDGQGTGAPADAAASSEVDAVAAAEADAVAGSEVDAKDVVAPPRDATPPPHDRQVSPADADPPLPDASATSSDGASSADLARPPIDAGPPPDDAAEIATPDGAASPRDATGAVDAGAPMPDVAEGSPEPPLPGPPTVLPPPEAPGIPLLDDPAGVVCEAAPASPAPPESPINLARSCVLEAPALPAEFDRLNGRLERVTDLAPPGAPPGTAHTLTETWLWTGDGELWRQTTAERTSDGLTTCTRTRTADCVHAPEAGTDLTAETDQTACDGVVTASDERVDIFWAAPDGAVSRRARFFAWAPRSPLVEAFGYDETGRLELVVTLICSGERSEGEILLADCRLRSFTRYLYADDGTLAAREIGGGQGIGRRTLYGAGCPVVERPPAVRLVPEPPVADWPGGVLCGPLAVDAPPPAAPTSPARDCALAGPPGMPAELQGPFASAQVSGASAEQVPEPDCDDPAWCPSETWSTTWFWNVLGEVESIVSSSGSWAGGDSWCGEQRTTRCVHPPGTDVYLAGTVSQGWCDHGLRGSGIDGDVRIAQYDEAERLAREWRWGSPAGWDEPPTADILEVRYDEVGRVALQLSIACVVYADPMSLVGPAGALPVPVDECWLWSFERTLYGPDGGVAIREFGGPEGVRSRLSAECPVP